jgi:hypothetical protein
MKNTKLVDRAKKTILEALELINKEIILHQNGRSLVSSQPQLKKFKRYLEKFLYEIENDNLTFENVGIGKIIADSWPYDSLLGEKLIKAEQVYLSLK